MSKFKLCITGNLGFEFWMDISEYDGQYKISTYGNVKNKYGKLFSLQSDRYGYKSVLLRKNGKQKRNMVHRLVISSFVPNPYGLPEVNHKDENPPNNRVENLEWCTHKYNINYGNRNAKVSAILKEVIKSTPVVQYDKDMSLIGEFRSTREAGRQTGVSQGGICKVCSGKRKTAGGYIWRYKKEDVV